MSQGGPGRTIQQEQDKFLPDMCVQAMFCGFIDLLAYAWQRKRQKRSRKFLVLFSQPSISRDCEILH